MKEHVERRSYSRGFTAENTSKGTDKSREQNPQQMPHGSAAAGRTLRLCPTLPHLLPVSYRHRP